MNIEMTRHRKASPKVPNYIVLQYYTYLEDVDGARLRVYGEGRRGIPPVFALGHRRWRHRRGRDINTRTVTTWFDFTVVVTMLLQVTGREGVSGGCGGGDGGGVGL